MQRIKSNPPQWRNHFVELYQLWEGDIGWDRCTSEEKRHILRFGVFSTLLFISGISWLTIPSLIGLIFSLEDLKKINIEE